MTMNNKNTIVFNGQPLTIEDICRIAGQQAHVEPSTQGDVIKRIDKGALFIAALLKEQGFVYRVSTCHGDSRIAIQKNSVFCFLA